MVQSFDELFGNIHTQENSDGSSTFVVPGPINTRVELVKRKFILNRKFIAGPEQSFDFDSEKEAIDFVTDRVKEMRCFLKYVGRTGSDLIVSPMTNSKGEMIWNVQLPVEKNHSFQANLVCIFKLMEV